MFSRRPGFVTVAVMLMLRGTRVEAAPTGEGFARPPPLTHHAVTPEKSLAPNPSWYLKQWRLSTGATRADGPGGTVTRSGSGWLGRADPAATVPDRQVQMLKMITALQELQRTFNSTLGSRITVVPRAGGRNPGRKHKVLAAADGDPKPTATTTTAAPPLADSTGPSLTGRTFKKSLLSQTKKTNKRVCFWKYCSQN